MTLPPLAVLAGMAATTLYIGSHLPMLHKAARTRDLSSYSRGSLVLANVGNVVQSIYVLSLPAGPIWVLQGFYNVSTAVMLALYERDVRVRRSVGSDRADTCALTSVGSQT